MKRLFPAVLLLFTGCFSCGKASQVEPVEEELKVYRPAAPPLEDRHTSSNLERAKPGDWVRYQVTKNGNETSVQLGAVRAEEIALWVEVIEEGDPKRASLRRISFDGQVTAARFQEFPASGPPSEVVDQPISPAEEIHRDPPASEKVSDETRQIGSESVSLKVYRRIFRDDSVGREYEEEEGWSDKIPPLLEGMQGAGLAFRKTPAVSLKVLEWGTGYTPSIK